MCRKLVVHPCLRKLAVYPVVEKRLFLVPSKETCGKSRIGGNVLCPSADLVVVAFHPGRHLVEQVKRRQGKNIGLCRLSRKAGLCAEVVYRKKLRSMGEKPHRCRTQGVGLAKFSHVADVFREKVSDISTKPLLPVTIRELENLGISAAEGGMDKRGLVEPADNAPEVLLEYLFEKVRRRTVDFAEGESPQSYRPESSREGVLDLFDESEIGASRQKVLTARVVMINFDLDLVKEFRHLLYLVNDKCFASRSTDKQFWI